MMSRTCRYLLAAALTLGALAPAAMAGNWSWKLSDERYKQLNQFERAQYDKAAKLYETGQWASAAAEFEKFKVQFQDSSAISYVLMMQGLSLHQAHTRNKAIKIYQEVVDCFPGTEDAGACLYWMGTAQLENGNTLKGLQAMKTMIETKEYQKSPLAGGAVRQLGDNYWRNKDYEQAVKYWQIAIKDFGQDNDQERQYALSNLIAYHIINKSLPALDKFLITAGSEDEHKQRQALLDQIWTRAWGLYTGEGWRFRREKLDDKKQAAEVKAMFEYMRGTKASMEKADPWVYYDHTLSICAYFYRDKDELKKLLDEAVVYVKTIKEKEKQDADYSRIVDVMRESQFGEHARVVLAVMNDRLMASFAMAQLLETEAKWDDACKELESLEASGHADWKPRAQMERARLYKDVLGKYDKAIELYTAVNRPPETLWYTADAYWRWDSTGGNKLKEALSSLTEVENSFPDWAARAAWMKVTYLEAKGETKKAIAQALRIMKTYKKTGEESQAHLYLEGKGIKTGGGSTDSE